MSVFKHSSIKTKMIAGFSLIILLVTALGIYNYISVKQVNQKTENIIDNQVQLLISNTQIANSMANGLRVANSYILTGNPKYKEMFTEFGDHGVHYAEHMKDVLGEKYFDPTGVDLAEEWRKSIIKDVFGEFDAGNIELASDNLEKLDPIGEESIGTFSHWASVEENEINELGADVIKNGQSTLTVIIVVTLVVILFSIVIALLTSRMITNPITNVKTRMQLIADGDLSMAPLTAQSNDELGELVIATNEMQETTRGLLDSINQLSGVVSNESEELSSGAYEVQEASEQMASTMQDLSVGSESQAHSVSSLSEMMTAFSAKIVEVNRNGQTIQTASAEVLKMTNEGSHLMDTSTAQMNKIDQIVQDAVKKVEGLDIHSQRISELVSVIKGLAEQTNLLALNAAIEAARAGEHGKGFAVVAEEVRTLAEQSSSSVTNITEIVVEIQKESSMVVESLQVGYQEVEQGTEQISATGVTFNEISLAVMNMVQNIASVSDNLSEVMSNSQEMTNSIQEIAAISEESASGIEQTASSSQNMGSIMEEVAHQAKELSQSAIELNSLVGRFKV